MMKSMSFSISVDVVSEFIRAAHSVHNDLQLFALLLGDRALEEADGELVGLIHIRTGFGVAATHIDLRVPIVLVDDEAFRLGLLTCIADCRSERLEVGVFHHFGVGFGFPFHPFGIISRDTHPDTEGVSLTTLPV